MLWRSHLLVSHRHCFIDISENTQQSYTGTKPKKSAEKTEELKRQEGYGSTNQCNDQLDSVLNGPAGHSPATEKEKRGGAAICALCKTGR